MKSTGLCNERWPTETAKIRDKVLPYLENRETVLDIGCGREKILPRAVGVDMASYRCVDVVLDGPDAIYELNKLFPMANGEEKADAIYSSHFLEHVASWSLALAAMSRCLGPHGLLALYLPDDDYYDNDSNPSHLHKFTYKQFVEDFKQFNFDLLEHGPDVGPGRYSFYLIAEKQRWAP